MSETLYLVHHGIKGQRWGIRRYQNFDGSYTAAGLKRYQKAKDAYDESRAKYKEVKASGDKMATQRARNEMRVARAEEKKHYRHLKQDKLGDEGKQLYAEGKRINVNKGTIRKVSSIISAAGLVGAAVAYYSPYVVGKTLTVGRMSIPVNAITVTSAVLAGTTAAVGATKLIGRAVTEPTNKRLRAYYAHTSNY